MKRMQAYRFQICATPKQERKLLSFAGCRRFVYNKALALQKDRFEAGEKRLGYAELCRQLTQWKHGQATSFLELAPSQALQQALKDLDRGYSNFFAGRAKLPRFQKKGRRERFRYPDGKQIRLDEQNSRILLPKLGWLRYRKSREIEGTIKNVTVSCDAGKWYVSIQTEREVEKPESINNSIVGIDMGVVRFATVSDGTVYEPPNSFRKNERKLAKKQRDLARKKRWSANWNKQVRKIQKLHHRIRNTRRDFQHKASTSICKNHAMIVVEDLNVKAMSKSARGSVECPGTRVKAKSGLNKSILDQGWYEFRKQLEYKSLWRGGVLIAVSPMNTSIKCAACGNVHTENRMSQEKFLCIDCGRAENADLNASNNILAAGRAVISLWRDSDRNSVKQEPTVSAVSTA